MMIAWPSTQAPQKPQIPWGARARGQEAVNDDAIVAPRAGGAKVWVDP